MTHDEDIMSPAPQGAYELEDSFSSSSHRFTVSNASSTPKKSAPSSTAVVSQTDYIPMDYDAELEACSDVVFSESSYYCTMSASSNGEAESSDASAEQDYVPYDYDEALYGHDDAFTPSDSAPAVPEAYSEAWQRAQEAQWARHVEGRHYAWCQRMAGESCFSNQEQSQYALKSLLHEACERDLRHLRAMPASAFAPCGTVEDRRMEVNRSASCTSMTSLTAYIEAQQLRARYLDGHLDADASDIDLRKANYLASARAQWHHLAEYVSRELSEDSMRLRSLSNAIQQLCLFRTGSVAPDLEVIFSRCTVARPATPYSILFGVSRELDLTLVESQKRERRQHSEKVLATLATHKTLFMPPTLYAAEEQRPVPVPQETGLLGAIGCPLTTVSSPVSGPLKHSPLFSLILDPSEFEMTPPLLLDGIDEDEDDVAALDGAFDAAAVISPWEVSLPWSSPSVENDFSLGTLSQPEAPRTANIALRSNALSWEELSENVSYSAYPNMVSGGAFTPKPPSAIASADATSAAEVLTRPSLLGRPNNSISSSNSANNLYSLPSALLQGTSTGLAGVVLSPAACSAMNCELSLDASPSRFSSVTEEGQSSEGGEGTCVSDVQTFSGQWALPEAPATRSPELFWLTPAVPLDADHTALAAAPQNVPRLSLQLLQHHEQHVSSGRTQAGSVSGRARTHQDIENMCRGWLFDTTTCHFRSSSTESVATERGTEHLTFFAEMMDDEDIRLDSEETPLAV